jgi:acetyl esterase
MHASSGTINRPRYEAICRMTLKRVHLLAFGVAAIIVAGCYLLVQLSSWPMVLRRRLIWNQSGIETSRALEKHVPAGVSAELNLHYDPNNTSAFLDVFYPSELQKTDKVLPTIVWVHGGSWISGSKDYIANYLKILAARGFTTVGVDYPLAPGETYPAPIREVNAALAYLEQNAQRLHVDQSKLFLAGDSAGSQIAAQLANIISAPSYAGSVGIAPSIQRPQLRGIILYCGVYDAALGHHFKRYGVLWAYFGTKDFMNDPRLQQFSVARQITNNFPPIFLSAGNADIFAPQSHFFAEIAEARGIAVDSLFFADDYSPSLPHEYQFDLDTDAGRLAMERSVKFLLDRAQ